MGVFSWLKKDPFVQRKQVPSKIFWDKLEKNYKESVRVFVPQLIGAIQPGSYRSDGQIHLDINSLEEAVFQMFDAMAFVAGTYYAALLEKNIVFSSDEDFLKNTIFNDLMSMINEMDMSGINKETLEKRAFGYGNACKNGISCGASMYGFLDMTFEQIEEWCQNSQVKCALLLCDYIAYYKLTRSYAKLADLQRLKMTAKSNSPSQIDYLKTIYHKAYSISKAIHSIVTMSIEECR